MSLGMMCIADINTATFIKVNPAFTRVLGYSQEELLSRPFTEFVHPDDLGPTIDLVEKSLKKGREIFQFENRYRVKSGGYRWLEWTSHPVPADGITYATAHDITDKKRILKEIEASENRYRMLVESTNSFVFILGADGRFEFVNRYWIDRIGFTAEEVLGESGFDLVASESIGEVKKKFAKVLNGHFVDSIEFISKTKSGGTINALINLVPVLDSSGKVVRIFGTGVDITEREQAEQALKQSEQALALKNRISNIFLTMPDNRIYDGVLAVVLEAMQSRYGLFGYIDSNGAWSCPSEIGGKSGCSDKIMAFPRDSWNGIWGRAMIEKKTQCANMPASLPEIGVSVARSLDVPIIYRKQLVGNLLIADKATDYDENDRQTLENIADSIAPILHSRLEIRKREKESEELKTRFHDIQRLESIGRLAGGVAHDFNNMLGVIIGYGESVVEQLHRESPLREDAEQIVEAGMRSAALTRQLLAFSRKQTLQPEVLDINGVVMNLKKMLNRLIGEDIELSILLAEDLYRVMADPVQIELAIMNLVVNARDAMPMGGRLMIESANIELDEEYAREHQGVKAGKHIMLAISDTGAGMNKKTLSKVFEPFYTTKEKGKGTGLGLSTVYGIVKQSGGNIWAYSEPGHGTTFKIYLPQTEEEPAPKEKQILEKMPGSCAGRILVVEDEESLRGLLVRMLSKNGYEVSFVEDGQRALDLVGKKELNPDLLITDVIMPGMSGPVLVEKLRKMCPELKVLFMSGYTDNVIVHHGVLDPGTPFIQKPFNINEILQKVQEVLGSGPK
jgi:PAS domain S-box-containing protein